jgi:multidrug transporter EmrE-like cation transporter
MKLTNVTFLYVLLFILAIVIIECAAQYCLKRYAKCEGYQWFILGIITYSVVAFLLVLSFDYEKMAIVNIMWGSLSALILTLVAYYFYDEKLSWKQILGIIVILIGTWLIHTS